jgi:hypothetical protein
MTDTLLLENLRCDGASHDGCERGCRLLWKEAWLSDHPPVSREGMASARTPATLKTKQGDRYYCQSTELAAATSEIRGQDVLHHLGDVWFGEISPAVFARHVARAVFNRLRRLAGVAARDEVHGGPHETDTVPLGLQAGEWVEVKSPEEIGTTLNDQGKNRGLAFDRAMLEYCGKRYRVLRRVDRIIQEETGRMVSLGNTVILDDVICRSFGCPRGNLFYWRETWLRRVATNAQVP